MFSPTEFLKWPNRKKVLITWFTMIMLSACSLKVSVVPVGKVLSDAEIGKPYSTDIIITGGAVFSLDSSGKDKFIGEIAPSDTGLALKYCTDAPGHNCIRVYGVPMKSGIVHIRVSGGLFGTNVTSGSRFDKTYQITIKGAK